MKPFPFLGHRSGGATQIVIWQVLPDGSPKRKTYRVLPRDADRWDVLLAVWKGKTAAASPWHHESLSDDRVFSALAALVRAAPNYIPQTTARLTGRGDVADGLYAGLAGRAPRAETLRDAVLAMRGAGKSPMRAVVDDLLLERLPALLGFEFECDLVIHHLQALISEVKANTVPRSTRFTDALAERVRQIHHEASLALEPGALDWSKPTRVTAAIAAEQWAQLAEGFRETEPAHVTTLLSLGHAQRVALARLQPMFALRMANAAALMLPRGDFVDALALYDAALEGELPAAVLANPLYAVSDDNNHLGLELERTRAGRYLERCLPAGARNAGVFLNAAPVFMELGEPDRAVEMLKKAKAGGVDVKAFRNEVLFVPLRDRPDFKSIIGSR